MDQAAPPEPAPAPGSGGQGGAPANGAGASPDAVTRPPDDAGVAAAEFERALELHEHGDLEAAALTYRRAEQHGEPEAAFNLGVLLYESGDVAGAEATWRRCLSYEHARAATNLGFLLEERGDVRRALLAYSAAERWGDPEGRRLGAELLKSSTGVHPSGS